MPPAQEDTASLNTPSNAGGHGWAQWALFALALTLGGFALAYQWWAPLTRAGVPTIQGLDDTGYYVWARSLVVDGDLNFENDFAEAPTTSREAVAVLAAMPRPANGRINNKWPPGWGMATVPWLAVGHLAAKISGQPADGWSLPYFIAVWVGHLLYNAAGAWCALCWLRRHTSNQAAWLAFSVLWIASPLLYYQTNRVSMPHGLLFNLTALTWLVADRIQHGKERAVEWILLGAAAGLMVCTRLTAVGLLLYPAWMVTLRFIRGQRNWIRLASGVGAGALLLGLGLVARRVADGSWFTEPYQGEHLNLADPAWWNLFFSPRHGLFYWHPILLLGTLGLTLGIATRRLPGSVLVACLSIAWVNAAWWCWWFGSSYGNRSFDGCILAAMLGLAWLWDRAGVTGRRSLAVLLLLGVAHSSVLLVCFVVQAIPRSDPVTYLDLGRAAAGLLGIGP